MRALRLALKTAENPRAVRESSLWNWTIAAGPVVLGWRPVSSDPQYRPITRFHSCRPSLICIHKHIQQYGSSICMHVKHYYAQMKAREPSPVYSELYNHTRIVIGTSEFSRKKTFTRFYLSTTRVAVLELESRPYCRHKETWKTRKTMDGRHQRLDRFTSG